MDLIGPPAGSGATLPKPPPSPKPAPAMAAPRIAQRANDLHAGPQASPVIDLRETKPAAVAHTSRGRLTGAPGAGAHDRHISQFTDRFERARNFSRSAQISRFGADAHGNVLDPAKMYDKFGNPTLNTLTSSPQPVTYGAHSAPAPRPAQLPPAPRELPHLAATQHAAMARLTVTAPAPAATPTAPAPRPAAFKPTFKLSTNAGRYAATAAAVLVMGGYIWFQNYPKLTIQNASAKAGITATMPSYLPSSYTLAGTHTKSGSVSLSFTSPSTTNPLTITQQSSSWDPSSLLDNYVAKNTDDYDAVGGQGLTIYLFGENTATWVNHGIWYSIAGAQQLSRDQVLKIAYSL